MGRLRSLLVSLFTLLLPANVTKGQAAFDGQGFIFNCPPLLTQCVPVNITWTGGTQPYSLRILRQSSSQILRQFDGILATHFTWDTDLPAGTSVSFELDDGGSVLRFIPDPITIGAGPNATCIHDVYSVSTSLGPSMTAFSTSLGSRTTWDIASSTQPSLWAGNSRSQSQSTKRVPLSAGEIVFIVVTCVILLLLHICAWRYYAARRRRTEGADAEKPESGEGGDNVEEQPEGPDRDDDQILFGDPANVYAVVGRAPDGQVTESATNPFEDPQDPPQTDRMQTSTATAGQSPQDWTSTTSPLATTPVVSDRNASATRPRQPKVVRRARPLSVQSDAPTVSDADATVRLSTTTSSTLPPSYRTRQSTVDTPRYPAFPPPAYTPPSAFVVSQRARRRTPPVPRKLQQAQAGASNSASTGLGNVDADGVDPFSDRYSTQPEPEPESRRPEESGSECSDPDRSDVLGAPKGTRGADTDSDARTESISEAGATIRAAGEEG